MILLVYTAILVSHGLLNHYGIRPVAWLNDFSVTVHIVGVAVIVGVLLLFRSQTAHVLLYSDLPKR